MPFLSLTAIESPAVIVPAQIQSSSTADTTTPNNNDNTTIKSGIADGNAKTTSATTSTKPANPETQTQTKFLKLTAEPKRQGNA